MAENKTKYTTLQAENGTVLYPKTSVKAVKDFDTGKTQKEINKTLQDDVEKLKTTSDSSVSELTSLKATLDEVKKGQKFKGTYDSVSSFPAIPSNIEEAEGWYAILKVSKGNDKFYIVDQTEREWVEKGESTSIIYDGIKKVNGLESVEGNVTIDATNINATVSGETKTIQDTLIGLKDISDEQRELIETVAAKHNVLYVTEAEMQDIDELEDGQVVVCVEEGTYAQGSIYKLNAGVWEEITASGTEITDTLTLSKEVVIPALNGSVTYENVTSDYIFEQDEEGYWVSTITSNTGYSILKITFNLDRKTDIKFDFVQEKVGDYSRQVMFSDIDCLLSSSNSQDSVGVFKNTYNQTNGSVIYYDFPEGEHFVTVKLYKNYGGDNYPYLKFKLSTPIQSDATTKISSNSIYINDNSCLQIEDSDIINKNNINLLIGEEDKPIQLWNLSNGFYKIKGYFEILRIFNVSNEILNSGIVDVSVYTDTGNGFKIIFLYNASFKQTAENVAGYRDSSIMLDGFSKNPREYDIYNANAIIQLKYRLNNESATSVQYFSMHADKNVLIKYNGSSRLNFYPAALPTDNTDKYTPLSDYNPATKKYVDDKILDYRPVLELDNPEEQIYVTNSIATSTDVDDNRLYYYKIVGSELIPNEVAYYTTYSGEILISKNILNCGITDWLFYINWKYNPYKGSSTVYEKSNYLRLSNGSLQWGNVYIYSPDVGWADDGINDDNYFNLHRYILLNPSNFGFNGYEVYVEFNVSNYRISFDYLKNGKFVPVSKPTQLALYEDLANAGGGVGGSKPITQFEGPEYVWEEKFDNTFGTGLENDNRLFFYKNNGVQEVDLPLQEHIDLKMQNLRIDEAVVDKLPISGTGTESVTFNLMKNNGEEIEVVLSVDYTDGVVNSVYIYPFTKEQQYLYQDGKWNYSLIPTSSFVEEADTMIYTSDPNSILVPFLSIVDKISGQQAIRVALYDDVASGGAGGESITLSKEVVIPALNGSVTYENVTSDYIFEQDEEGYWVSNNSSVAWSYAIIRINFSLNRETNISFEYMQEQEGNVNYGDFAYFSEIDKNLSLDSERTNALFSTDGITSGTVTYKNFPAGEHFVEVKFKKYYDSGTRTFKFKLSTNLQQDEDKYTSKQSIIIGDNNNLQIEGKNILKDGDIPMPVKKITGTESEPIILYDLEPGLYVLEHYFKITKKSSLQKVFESKIDENGSGFEELSWVLMEIKELDRYYGNRTVIIYNGYANGQNICHSIDAVNEHWGIGSFTISEGSNDLTHTRSNNLLKYINPYDGSKDSLFLSTENTNTYVPNTDYNPATKKYVDDSVENARYIKNYENIEENIKISQLATSSDYEDNKLYYSKKNGERIDYVDVIIYNDYKNMYINKNSFDDDFWKQQIYSTINLLSVDVYGSYGHIASDYIYVQIDGDGIVERIYGSWGDAIYTYQNGWNSFGDENYFDLIEHYNNIWGEITKVQVNQVYTDLNGIFQTKDIVDLSKLVRIALYEDLENAGGGSNVADIEASIDNSTYVMTLKLVDGDGNQVGTGKTIDLPLESMVVGGTYNNGTKEIQLTLQNGNKIKIPVSDLVGGLVPATRKINGKSLENDINLTAEDLGISFEGEPTIEANDGILTIKVNNTEVGQFSANQSDSSTINIPVPVQSVNGKDGNITLTSDDINLSLLFEGEQEAIEVTVQEFGQMLAEEMPKLGSDIADLWNVSINNKCLTVRDIDLTANDIKFEKYNNNTLEKEISDMNVVINEVDAKADDAKNTASSASQKALQNETSINTLKAVTINNKALSGDIVLKTSDLINDSNYVNSSTLNNKAATLGSDINLTMNETNYQITAQLVNESGTALGTAKTIDLPLETMVVGASYDDATEKITLTLKNGTTTSFSVADLVKGLVSDTRTINGKPLSSNITLSASDVGALPSATTIPTVNNGTLTIQKNGTTVKTFTANSSSNVTANITVPTGTAADKNYTTTMDNSDNLPTAAAIQAYVTSRGYVTSSGSVASATNANNAIYATNATNDEGGRNIYETYAKKSDLGTQAVFTLSGTTLTIVPK